MSSQQQQLHAVRAPHVAVALLAAFLGVSAAVLAWYATSVAGARYKQSGDPFPGVATAMSDVVGNYLVSAVAGLTLGALVYVVIAARPDDEGYVDITVYPAYRAAARVATAWVALAVLMVPVAAADTTGLSVTRLIGEGYLAYGISVSDPAAAWIVTAGAGLVVLSAVRFSLKWSTAVAALLPAMIGVVAVPVVGNAAQGPNHDYTTGVVMMCTVALAGSFGLRIAWLRRPRHVLGACDDRIVRRRVAPVLVVLDGVVLVCAVVLSLAWSPGNFLQDTASGRATVIMIGVTGLALGADALTYRGRAARWWLTPDALQTLAAAAGLSAIAAWAVIDTRVAPGLLSHPFTAWDVFLGYTLRTGPSVPTILSVWRVDLIVVGLTITAATAYAIGVCRLRRAGHAWPLGRTLSWAAGCVCVIAASGTGIKAYGTAMFSVHMIDHMLVSMLAPLLLVLGAPLTLALRACATLRGHQSMMLQDELNHLINSRLIAVVTNPVVALGLYVGSLFAVYFTPLFDVLVRYHWGHVLMTLWFFTTGYLFFSVVVAIDPGPRRLPVLARLGLLVAAMPFHALFGIALMTSTTIVGESFYRELALPWVADLRRDQWLGGVFTWVGGLIPVIVVAVVLIIEWWRADYGVRGRWTDPGGPDDELLAAWANSRQ